MNISEQIGKTSDGVDQSQSRVHLNFLDGLRGVAALYVMFHHMWLALFGMSASAGLKGLAINWILYGHLAVDVFIVLSGFCLAIPVGRSKYLKGGAVNFSKGALAVFFPLFMHLCSCA